jgi:hypothetical protein
VVAPDMNEEHDDLNLNSITYMGYIHIGYKRRKYFIHICNNLMFENPI